MSSDVASNPPHTATESKSARKKKSKAEAATAIPTKPASETNESSAPIEGKTNGHDTGSDNAYVKELQKTIRNVTKKLTLMQKVDAIIAENPDATLDELVAARKINADQKAQALKKPLLQIQLSQLEEQIVQYKKFDQEYQEKLAAEKQLLASAHSEELEKLRETLKAEAEIEKKKDFRKRFLTLSRFLRAAAARRQIEDEQNAPLSLAFEGALLLVYSGDATAVDAAEKLIEGSQEKVPNTEGELLTVSYSEVKEAALLEAPYSAEEQWVDDVAQARPGPPEMDSATDPTIANAGLTELEDATALANTAGASLEQAAPAATNIDAGAANAAADEKWDEKQAGSEDALADSYEIIPRPAGETEAPAPTGITRSWADEQPDLQNQTEAPVAIPNDGFREVHHHRGNRGRGGSHGERGRGGGYRGRGGPRGEGRGRGEHHRRGRGGGHFRGNRGNRGEIAQQS